MNKWSKWSLVVSGLGLVIGFIGDLIADKANKEDLISELEERYVLTPRSDD